MKLIIKLLSLILTFSLMLCLGGCDSDSGNDGSTELDPNRDSGNDGSTELDPDRTTEPCSMGGETRVFGSLHDTTYCYPDGDGYYHVGFGHHHHK